MSQINYFIPISAALCFNLAEIEQACAYESNDFIVRSGLVSVHPHDSSSVIDIATPNLGASGNAKVAVNSEQQLGLTLEYMVSGKYGIELLAATPFSHDILGDGTLKGVGKLGKTKHLPPTLSAHYYFANPKSNIQPYVGIGLNYTTFFDTSASPLLDNAATIDTLATLSGAAPGTITSAQNTDIDLDDSIGLSFQAGVDIGISESLSFSASYWRIDIDTKATITSDTNAGQVVANVDVDIDPSVVMIGLAFKF